MTTNNFVGVHLWFELCSGKRVIQTNIQERILFFSNEQRMHEHIGRMTNELFEKGLAYNGRNANRYYELVFEILDDDCIRFVIKGKQPALVA